MAALGSLESLCGAFPEAIRAAMLAYTREWATTLRFGAPASTAVRAENMAGALVPFVTSGTSNGEVAVPHMLSRVPRVLIPILPLGTVNATMPTLTVTKAADATYFYVSSDTLSAGAWAYVE